MVPPAKPLMQPALSRLADLLALPDGGRHHEIIEGALSEKDASAEHGVAQSRVGRMLAPFDRRPGGRFPGGWWFATEVLIDFGGPNQLRPDVAGWRREHMPERPTGVVVSVVPDWVCEVVSPSNASNDTVKKKRVYHQRHVPHYWLIDPVQETLSVLRWSQDGYVEILCALRSERGAEEPERERRVRWRACPQRAEPANRVRAEPFEVVELQVGVFFGDDEVD